MAGGVEALLGFVFGEKALVDGALAGVVDAIGDAGKVGIDAGEVEVVVDLVEKIAKGSGIAIAGADEARELGRKLLLDSFFENRAAESGAGGEETVEEAARGFIEVAVGLFRAGRGHDAFAQSGGASDGGLNELDEFHHKGGTEQIVFVGIEGALDGLPGGCVGDGVGRLEAGKRGEALAGVLDEALTHLVGEASPVGDEGSGVAAVADAQLVVNDAGKNATQLLETIATREFGNGHAEFAAGCVVERLGEELQLELGGADGHGACS